MTRKWNVKIEHFEEIESTQNYPVNFPLQEKDLYCIFARTQTGGQGRGDRLWISPLGNFYGTFIFKKPLETKFPLPTLSLMAAAILSKSLRSHLHPCPVIQLKWPNDVLIHGKKCAGILLTSTATQIRIGLGLNILTKPLFDPKKMTRVPLALNDLPLEAPFDAKAWLRSFLQHLIEFYSLWLQGEDHPWRELWAQQGLFETTLKLRNGSVVVPSGIGQQGELLCEGGQCLYHEELI